MPASFDWLKVQRRNPPSHHHFGHLARTMVWVLPGRKLGPWSEFPFLYRFTIPSNAGGSNSPWSEFWSEFPHFMGMGVVPAPSIKWLKMTEGDWNDWKWLTIDWKWLQSTEISLWIWASPFFRAPEKRKKDLPFCPVGQPRPEPSPKSSPAGCLSEVPDRGDFGEENCLGKGGVDRAFEELSGIGPYKFPQQKVLTDGWSICISPGKGMDQWPSKFSESFGLDRYWSIECSYLTREQMSAKERLANNRVWNDQVWELPTTCLALRSRLPARE